MQGRSIVEIDTVDDGAVALAPLQANARDTRAQKKGADNFWLAPNLLWSSVPTECPEELLRAQPVLGHDPSIPRCLEGTAQTL